VGPFKDNEAFRVGDNSGIRTGYFRPFAGSEALCWRLAHVPGRAKSPLQVRARPTLSRGGLDCFRLRSSGFSRKLTAFKLPDEAGLQLGIPPQKNGKSLGCPKTGWKPQDLKARRFLIFLDPVLISIHRPLACHTCDGLPGLTALWPGAQSAGSPLETAHGCGVGLYNFTPPHAPRAASMPDDKFFSNGQISSLRPYGPALRLTKAATSLGQGSERRKGMIPLTPLIHFVRTSKFFRDKRKLTPVMLGGLYFALVSHGKSGRQDGKLN